MPEPEIKQINFTESHDREWIVKCITEDGKILNGQPFMAVDHPNWSKLEQVTDRLRMMGFRPLSIPYNDGTLSEYSFKVAPLESAS
ncbi:hypothetical protein [Clavibacter michiganensis]|uniref:hypothetical protein n=1 Tax=Clavibacter michiganensis TaxID=28447 RepID=UPI001365EEBB|nr:hypothetical protein [Clavibacter michiganensis]MWJ14174.1 hypothetical protein [Clavibacter michiganensis subsp. michiganensis]MWJ49068.1 hypothetical protein [Clavibacter michiganensis subsp. michiganensis]